MISTLTKLAFLPVGLYLIFVIAVHFQQVQREILFLNWISFPNPETLKTPSLYGFPENQVRNFYIESKQNRKLGAWQITPLDSYWNEVNQGNKDFDDSYYDSFFTNKSTTTVLYLHGNAGNRASKHRPFTYQKLAGKNQFNVIAVDYSGFGDSEGKPTEKAIVEDAKAAWDWIIQKGASPDRIVILGHSLGTAVATKLTEELQDQNIAPKALILKAPFSNVKRAVFDFKILARYSILGPLGRVPQLKSYINNVLKLDFDSLSIIGKLKLPILILHGYEDNVLPIIHGETLYQEVMNSAKYETTTITQGIPQSVQVFSSEKNDHLIQFAKFKHIDHDNFHRFDTVFLIIQKFWDKISQ